MSLKKHRIEDIKEVVASVLKLDPNALSLSDLFKEDYDADSLSSVEILANLEKKFQIKIPQKSLVDMVNIIAAYQVLKEQEGWEEEV